MDNEWYYFVDKCLPFGAAISCALFQAFSDAVAHLVKWKTGKKAINYLDDFLFVALLRFMCSLQLSTFMEICKNINFPLSLEKTCWPTTKIVFLGLLLDTISQLVLLPKEKILKGRMWVDQMISKKKATIKEVQQLCGFLNFLGRAIVLGHAFTRCLYSLADDRNGKVKPHHHVKVKLEYKLDLQVWQNFLFEARSLC